MPQVTSSNHSPSKRQALDVIRHRKQAYLHTFDQENKFVREVLADLARFCRANKSTFDPNPDVRNLLEGRREVWLRIAKHLNMTESELYEVFVNGKD